MTTIESILDRLTQAVSGTDKEFFTDEEREKFAKFYCDKWDENRESSESRAKLACAMPSRDRGRR